MQSPLLWLTKYNARKFRMNLRLPALIPWMVWAGMAYGQVRTANVLYTFKEAESQPAYRLGNECFVSLDTVSNWGWKVDKQGDSIILTAEGHTLRMEVRYVAGKTTIPLRKAISELGGDSDWTIGTDTLNVFSNLRELTVRGLKVHAEGGLAFKGTPFYLSPGRTVIDLDGARLSPSTKEDLASNVKVQQYRPNVVRVTIPTSFVPKEPDQEIAESPNFDYQISKDQDLADNPYQQKVVENESTALRSPVAVRSIPPPPIVASSDKPEIISVTVDREGENSEVVGVHLPIPPTQDVLVDRSDPLSLELVLPVRAELPTSNAFLNSRDVESVVTRYSSRGTILTLQLTRPMASEVINDRSGVTIKLSSKGYGEGNLAGKIIVVDPGHGGHDRGAHMGELNEKDLTLPIGLDLADDLEKAGATVILTRHDDTFIPLMERSEISNRNHADVFISCHINSTGGAPTQSGTITFHHKGNRAAELLAECIQREIARVNGLPDLGVWSDGKIYGSGFSVLRNTRAPAVLIEMGFINQSRDRERMLTQDFKDSVAAAIVRGVRAFLGETKPNE
jgi:N-acetylmuramoyl-L-alanine amidase